ncbi:MAG: sulfur carrier protein ThiS [Nitrospirae bacterium]|nr:sulfur carrier protein ThiS [Nitrospirota bacterium]
MKIKLNGKEYELEREITVSDLLKKLDIHPQSVAVEVNLNIIKKQYYDKTFIKDGDHVEIVSFVGGGIVN